MWTTQLSFRTGAQGHHICVDCSSNVVQLFLSEPKINLPPKCMICKVDINESIFERQLTSAQLEIYRTIMLSLFWSKECLQENEELVHCSFCSYVEIREKSEGAQFIFCKHKDCGKTSCLICLRDCPTFEQGYEVSDYDSYSDDIEEMERHFICATLKAEKKMLDTSIENGQKMSCPGCGLSGMKDDACPSCQTSWCYFCGLKEVDCDKAQTGKESSIYDHNVDWDSNPERCPMYLTAIQDIDPSWPEDEDQCLEHFHRLRSLRLLRDAYETLGDAKFRKLNKQFGIIENCVNLTLINYDDDDMNADDSSNDEEIASIVSDDNMNPDDGSGDEEKHESPNVI
ncbi:unnamed protein product [Didymodactylos carnosus]|uniref:RING-type domain-containing protein n=1 Tax=Didymodactylos carnosus TaxID=1234261 RepID=A0A8S2DRG3_9BILA|nr:unnamed protein product [Didymodactylos carnosus]CAF3781875.1 unnamed protein product [Didymodactylos carnosus]